MLVNQSKVEGLLGLATKAGKIVCGTDATIEAILKRKVFSIIIAEDASSNTKEKFEKIADTNGIVFYIYGNIEQNSKAIGKTNKAVIAIKDRNFSEAIGQIISGGEAIGQNKDT